MENVLAGTEHNKDFNLYKDIRFRTGGEIYIGVVGPVRTGKSTFIKRFMDLMVLPFMENEAEKTRAQDELPQSGAGKTITTTEPKFIPKTAAKIKLSADLSVQVRLVDCVGYMIDGVSGHMENETERMVKTPWYDHEIPFTQAAEIGTKKVINDHSTIGIVVTTDGTIGELKREAYIEAENRAIEELKKLKKPFIVLVNSTKPYSREAKAIAEEIMKKHQVSTVCMNCEQMKVEDVNQILKNVLYEFPVTMIEFFMPKWVEMLKNDHPVKKTLIEKILEMTKDTNTIKDISQRPFVIESEYCKRCMTDNIDLSDGSVRMVLDVDDKYYYDMISEMTGEAICGEYELLSMLKEFSGMKQEYDKVLHAMEAVRIKGYGVVTPERTEIKLEKPEVIKHGNKFGVKIRAESPSIHMIRANVITEIAPIVGSQQQAEDLISYIMNSQENEEGIWDTNIFGKTVEQLVNDGIAGKIAMIGEESQYKLQETMQKIVNESNGGMICIII
ncbi:MAG: stage IV sporulation protein A [Lachnospiraceae bacterium]|nr:stage IV sporulation protein A [Lachnospiraceae bacterium]